MDELLVRPRRACELLGIRRSKLYSMLKAGQLQRVKLGPRTTGVTTESIRRLIAAQTQDEAA